MLCQLLYEEGREQGWPVQFLVWLSQVCWHSKLWITISVGIWKRRTQTKQQPKSTNPALKHSILFSTLSKCCHVAYKQKIILLDLKTFYTQFLMFCCFVIVLLYCKYSRLGCLFNKSLLTLQRWRWEQAIWPPSNRTHSPCFSFMRNKILVLLSSKDYWKMLGIAY